MTKHLILIIILLLSSCDDIDGVDFDGMSSDSGKTCYPIYSYEEYKKVDSIILSKRIKIGDYCIHE